MPQSRRRLSVSAAGWASRSAVLIVLLAGLALAAPASATTVSIRVEAPGQALVPKTTITLPSNVVAPDASNPGHACQPGTVLAALDAAANHQWAGQWTDGPGWSIDTIRGLTATAATGRHWDIYLNEHYLNDAPCTKPVANGDRLLFFPRCVTAATLCFAGKALWIQAPAQASPGVFFAVQVWEIVTGFDVFGNGESNVRPVENATVTSPDGRAFTDYNGQASIPLSNKGDNTVTVTKSTDVPDRANVCVTDGADGYCGTTLPPTNPFDPYAFCKTTGSDGYCNSPDKVAPVGRITAPLAGQAFSQGAGPKLIKGTVDFDPSDTDSVNLRLMRAATYKAYKVKKRKVLVVVKRHGKPVRRNGKLVRKRVTKKVRGKPYKRNGCFTWNPATSTWKLMKTCDASKATQFKADGADIWSFEFLTELPSGSYTLDALAKDGAGNVDSIPELGRNRITFKVG